MDCNAVGWLSMGFSRQEYWRGLPLPPPGTFPTQGSNPGLLRRRQFLYHLSHQGSPLTAAIPTVLSQVALSATATWAPCQEECSSPWERSKDDQGTVTSDPSSRLPEHGRRVLQEGTLRISPSFILNLESIPLCTGSWCIFYPNISLPLLKLPSLPPQLIPVTISKRIEIISMRISW